MSDTQTKPKQPKHMSADTAAQKFADILKWRLQPATPNPTLKAVRYDRDQPESGPVPEGDNYASTELAHPEPEGALNRSGFSVEPYP